jgi:exodeoxyribonuclease V alpha subunit
LKPQLIEKTYKVLESSRFTKTSEIDLIQVEKAIGILLEKGKIVEQSKRYYLKDNYDEQEILKDFAKLALHAPKENNNVKSFIKKYEERNNITLGREQKEAIENSCNSQISIITGGAGVGKTASLACIISYLLEEKGYKAEDIALCAPTGKASQRMQESIFKQVGRKMKATTIHVLLEVNPVDSKLETFRYNKDNKLKKRVVVVDETSMLNYKIACALISAIRKDTKVIFLGDIEQLEPVGAGFFFRDLIESKCPTTYLKEIHRQKGTSTIITLSQAIRDEHLFKDNIEKKSDFTFIDLPAHGYKFEYKLENIADIFIRGVKASSLDETMIITPLRETEGNCKIDSKTLSNYIQKILFPDKKDEIIIEKNGYRFKVGSKVIQTRNNNKRGLINGQIGYITAINSEKSEVVVSFDGEEYPLSNTEMDDLRLGYAITVHKSQGSDWKNVIYCCFNDTTMNKKNLVYTAVTRAKTNLVIIGNKETFLKADKLKANRKNSVLLNEEEANK